MKSDNNIPITDELIAKYLTGDSEPVEALALSDWLTIPENKQYFDALAMAWHRSRASTMPSFDKQAAWQKIVNETKTIQGVRSMPMAGRTWRFLKIAAAILLLATVGTFILLLNKTLPAADHNIATSSESKEHFFADQSAVTLFRNTAIDYPVHFGAHSRDIKLIRGEAFFRISKDNKKPFIVHTPYADVQVVGTEFNILLGANGAEVSVKEGQVRVITETDTVLLTAGSAALINQGRIKISPENVVDVNVWGYATRKLVFSDAPLKDVIRDIEKAYPCAIRLSNKNIEKCNFSATFDNDSIDKIVNFIADILNLTVNKHDNTFTLEGEGCP